MLTRPLARRHAVVTPSSSYSLSTMASSVLVLALFALVYALRSSFYNPNDGLGLLFCLPIAFAAVRFGPVVGIAAGLAGYLLFVRWAMDIAHDDIGTVGYVSRLTVFLLLGGLIGYFARAREELDVRSRLLFDLSPDAMGTLDLDGHIVAVNDAWRDAATHAHGAGELAPDWGLEPPAAGSSVAFEQAYPAVDGAPRTIEWFVQRDPRRPLLYVVGRDITERNEQTAHVRELLGTTQDARADERSRVSSQLHDFVLQQLLVALMHVERLEDEATPSSAASIDEFVRTAISALRKVIDGIQPLDMGHLDCRTVLERAASLVEDEWDVRITRAIDIAGDLDDERKLLAYRIVGEALRNAAKHAQAEHITFDAADRDGHLELTIRDDGRGLAEPVAVTDALAPAFGTGFNLLLEHVLASGGSCDVASTPGVGTSIIIGLPLLD